MHHATTIAASQGEDNPDPDDADDDFDSELAYQAERRKRMIHIAGLASTNSRGLDAARRAGNRNRDASSLILTILKTARASSVRCVG